ncbi:cytochrome c oxidase assembly factor CtaG [Gottfriedia luciferensis]|uniref:cytochrome c oxidase assembly factor CtaG n=1 Tax=Gottfriedia luciferensis TaxID=178774 RepID=UPI000B436579|nr:cytochrome c oxidase assembly factor CtaG [Gottfriedia luciferensis]
MINFGMFGFKALWSPYFLVFLVLVTLGYFYIINKQKKPTHTTLTKEKVYFVIGILLIYISQGSPIDLIGHIIFSAHMTEMAILYLVAPIFIIIGIPNWLWRNILKNNVVNSIFKFVTKPLIALIVFNVVFSIYHYPLVFDAVKTNNVYHFLFTNMLFFMALFMWFPVINSLPERQTLSDIQKIGYMFGNGILLTPACALIIFAGHPFYATYNDPVLWSKSMELCVSPDILKSLNISGPDVLNIMSAREDQQVGGIIMKIIQEIVYGSVIGYNFFKWAKREQNGNKIDPISSNPLLLKKS